MRARAVCAKPFSGLGASLLTGSNRSGLQPARWGNVMQILIVAFSLLLINAAAYGQEVRVDGIDFTEYGIYTLDRIVEGRDAHGISEATAANIRHAATLRTLPAQIGATFGFRYRVLGKPKGAPVDLRKIIIFPPPGITPLRSPQPIPQDEFTLHARIGEIFFSSYTLEDSFELVPGPWTIEIWYGAHKLGTQSFRVVGMPGCETGSCEGF